MKYACFLLSFLFVPGLVSCSKDNSQDLYQAGEKIYNLNYGKDSMDKLDFYLPFNRNSNTPFVILIHGGSWIAGDKREMNALQDSLMVKGIASASINYRFAAEKVHYTELMEDVAAATDYCYQHRAQWNIRADKYIIGGISAGAQMSLLYAYNYDNEGRIGAVFSEAGISDMTQVDWLNDAALTDMLAFMENMVGARYVVGQPLDKKFADASPRYHIKKVPTLLIHGTNDRKIPFTQSQMLADDLTRQDIPNKLVRFEGAGHDLGITNPAYYQSLLNEIEAWCKIYSQ